MMIGCCWLVPIRHPPEVPDVPMPLNTASFIEKQQMHKEGQALRHGVCPGITADPQMFKSCHNVA